MMYRFALLYLLDSAENAYLAAAVGVDVHAQGLPESLAMATQRGAVVVHGKVGAHSSFFVDDLGALFGEVLGKEPKKAVVLSLRKGTGDTLIGHLIAGVSNRLPYNDDYRTFFDLLAAQVANLITRTTLLVEERRRAKASCPLRLF